jgi:hypothetical protein
MASFKVSFNSFIFLSETLFTNQHHAAFTSSTGCRGERLLPSGVDFVFAQTGVVAEACPVVRA